MSTRHLRVRVAFEIIVQYFSGQTQPIENTQTEIYELVNERYDSAKKDDVKKTLTYLNHFGLVVKPESQRCWHIKPVREMCDWLHEVRNRNIENHDQELTIPIAFEIIIKDFSRDTDWHSTTDIEEHVFNVHQEQGGLPEYAVQNPVGWTLRFMNHFGFAEKNGRSDWRIKSVDDICGWLCALKAFGIYDEGMRNRELGFPELAISCFDNAIDLVPNNYLFYAQRAYSKRDLMRLDEALLDLDQAIRLCEQQNLPPHHSLQLQLTHGLIALLLEEHNDDA